MMAENDNDAALANEPLSVIHGINGGNHPESVYVFIDGAPRLRMSPDGDRLWLIYAGGDQREIPADMVTLISRHLLKGQKLRDAQ